MSSWCSPLLDTIRPFRSLAPVLSLLPVSASPSLHLHLPFPLIRVSTGEDGQNPPSVPRPLLPSSPPFLPSSIHPSIPPMPPFWPQLPPFTTIFVVQELMESDLGKVRSLHSKIKCKKPPFQLKCTRKTDFSYLI